MSITQQLQAILQARYGRDVRQAIHDSISDLNEIANTAQTSAKAYYEGTQALAQTVSGNVGIDDSTATLSTTYSSHKIEDKTRTNLLNPTLGTTTVDGVTCTANGDGTYTLNGRTTVGGLLPLATNIDTLELPKTYRLVGCPSGGTGSTFELSAVRIEDGSRTVYAIDYGNGATRKYESGAKYEIRIRMNANTPFDNVIFKPMLTTDLSATYDDFVQYSGDGELNQNVAEMYKTIETLKNAITELGGTV